MREAYPSNVTDKQWTILKPIVDNSNEARGRPRDVDMREVINAFTYIGKTGCQWPMLPHHLPAKSTVHYYFSKFRDDAHI